MNQWKNSEIYVKIITNLKLKNKCNLKTKKHIENYEVLFPLIVIDLDKIDIVFIKNQNSFL